MGGPIDWETLGRTLLAMLYGGVIGFERELAEKPAGLRTHILVGGASALMVLLGAYTIQQYQAQGSSAISADPLRVFQAIVVGVSFLGTGTIVVRREEGTVEGLTTAASLLMVAALGIAVAVGEGLLAGALTLAVLLVVRGVRRLEGYLGDR